MRRLMVDVMVFDVSDRLFAYRSGYVWIQDQPQLAGYYQGYMPHRGM